MALFSKRITENCHQTLLKRCDDLCLQSQAFFDEIKEDFNVTIDNELRNDVFFNDGELLKRLIVLKMPNQLYGVCDTNTIAATMVRRLNEIDEAIKNLNQFQPTEKKMIIINHFGRAYVPDEIKEVVKKSFAIRCT